MGVGVGEAVTIGGGVEAEEGVDEFEGEGLAGELVDHKGGLQGGDGADTEEASAVGCEVEEAQEADG